MVVSGNNLLVATTGENVLHMYTNANFRCKDVTIQDRIIDLSWTLRGHIVYTTSNKVGDEKSGGSKIVTIDEAGSTISVQKMADSMCLSVSEDNAICVTDKINGIYESKDDGMTWTHILRLPNDNTRCLQAIKVKCNQDEVVYWTLVESNNKFYLRTYTISNGVTEQNISLPGVDLSLSKMAYDGKEAILLAAYNSNSVLSIPINNPNDYKHLSFNVPIKKLIGINFDRSNQLLYLCCSETKLLQTRFKMKIFKLY